MRPNHPKNRNGDAGNDSQKLHKLLAQSGLGSRRGMEQLIEEGKVSVNGQPASVATRVAPGDAVMVDGKRVNLRFGVSQPRVLLYHKPEGEIVSRDDPEGRESVFDKLPAIHGGRWIACGRLDINTSGLLIFTNHGELANSLTHPRFQLEREYAVRLLGRLTDDQFDQLEAGVELEDGPAHVYSIEDRGGEGANHWYHIVIKEGRNREVRRLFEAIGLTVSRLIRVRFGQLEMPPYLKRGQVKELAVDQVREVMQWAGVSGGRGASQGDGQGNAQGRRMRDGKRGQPRAFGDAQPRGFGDAQPRSFGQPGQARRSGAGGKGQMPRRGGPGGYQSRAIGPMDMGEEDPRVRRDAQARRGQRQGQGQAQGQRQGQGSGDGQRRRGPRPGQGQGQGQGQRARGQGERGQQGQPQQNWRGPRPSQHRPADGAAAGPAEVREGEGNQRRRRRRRRPDAANAQGPMRSEQAGALPQTIRHEAAAPTSPARDYYDDDHGPGDVNGNVAGPAPASPDPRSAARKPNRRRRKPVTT